MIREHERSGKQDSEQDEQSADAENRWRDGSEFSAIHPPAAKPGQYAADDEAEFPLGSIWFASHIALLAYSFELA
jgi:hypothetical protein